MLTDMGRDAFQQSYDDLAASALRFLHESGGPGAVTEFARRRTGELEDRYRDVVSAAAPQDCQHHCPVAHVAAEFPQLCEAETEVFARLLGRHVQRLATIAHGDGICTTNVPHPIEDPDSSPATTTMHTTATGRNPS